MIAQAPLTREGQAAWTACQSSGVWRTAFAGMGGQYLITGLDWDAACRVATQLGGDLEPDLLTACLGAIERGRMAAQSLKLRQEETLQ